MDTIEYFNSPQGMYALTEEVFQDYHGGASERDFLLLVFLLAHLRELIVKGKKFEEIKKINNSLRTPGEALFCELWEMDEFQIIRQICNGSKHHKIERRLSEIQGFRPGLSLCGDRLGQRYLLIDGEDSRNIFMPVVMRYRKYFQNPALEVVE